MFSNLRGVGQAMLLGSSVFQHPAVCLPLLVQVKARSLVSASSTFPPLFYWKQLKEVLFMVLDGYEALCHGPS